MNDRTRALGMVCWHEFDGIRKRICDIDDGSEKMQCPHPATIVLIEDNGSAEYACRLDHLDILRRNPQDSDFLQSVTLLGQTATGFQIYRYTHKQVVL